MCSGYTGRNAIKEDLKVLARIKIRKRNEESKEQYELIKHGAVFIRFVTDEMH